MERFEFATAASTIFDNLTMIPENHDLDDFEIISMIDNEITIGVHKIAYIFLALLPVFVSEGEAVVAGFLGVVSGG